MLSMLIRRILPLLVLSSLALSSCVVHERRPPRGRGYHDRGPRRGPGPRYGPGPGRY
ncbi:MAG: hypothetical protein ACRYG7_50975 [Janthinobacterium lividum]